MTIARFKDLCLDARDAIGLGAFWSRVLGNRLTDRGDGSARLDPVAGHPDTERIWVNPVPEARSGKTRVHLDLWLAGDHPRPLIEAGATVLRAPGGDIHWWVMADPEGNEFCAFPPRDATDRPGAFQLVVDCADPGPLAAWWQTAIGGAVVAEPYGTCLVDGAGLPWRHWLFQAVPEPRAVKNRNHWDVTLTDRRPDALIALGAKLLREPDDDIDWWILADPEGNEFCAFAPDIA